MESLNILTVLGKIKDELKEEFNIKNIFLNIEPDGTITLHLIGVPSNLTKEEVEDKVNHLLQNFEKYKNLIKFGEITLIYEDEIDYFKDISFDDLKPLIFPFYNFWLMKKEEIYNKIKNYRQKLKSTYLAFYSVKGGIGRSTLSALVARALAEKGYKVIVVDVDLEAPTQEKLLLKNNFEQNEGLVDWLYLYLINKQPAKEGIFGTYIRKTNLSDNIYLLQSGNKQNLIDYLYKLSLLDIPHFIVDEKLTKGFFELLEHIEKEMSPDFVIFDSRAGISDIASLTLTMSSIVLFMFRPGEQDHAGVELVLPSLIEYATLFNTEEKNDSFYIFPIIFEPNVEDAEDKVNEAKEFINSILNRLQLNIEASSVLIPKIFKEDAELKYSNFEKISNYDLNKIKEIVETIIEYSSVPSENLIIPDELNLNIKKRILKTKYLFGKLEEDVVNLKNFLPFYKLKNILEFHNIFIIGNKGAGKTTIYKFLKDKENWDWLKKNRLMTSEEEFIPFYSPSGDEVIEKLPNDEKMSDRKLWQSLIFYRLQNLTQNLNKFFIDFTQKFLKNELKIKSTADIQELDESLSKKGKRYILMVDGIEKISENYSLSIKISNTLAELFYDLRNLKNIKFKFFIRKDIKRKWNFPNIGHLEDYTTEIKWENYDLYRMVFKKAFLKSNSLLDFILNKLQVPLEREKVKERLENGNYKEITELLPNNRIDEIIKIIFGEKMTPSGKGKAAYVKNWILNRIADANEDKHPRDIVDLLNNAVEIEREFLEKGEEKYPSKIISHRALLDALPKVSERRLSDFEKDEYPHLKEIFEAFRREKTPMWYEDLKTILQKKANLKETEIEQTIEELKSAGFLNEQIVKRKETGKKEKKFSIPHIFAKALEMTIYGY